MFLNDKDPKMEKNFWLALVLSMLIMLGYPYFMKWFHPVAPQDGTTQTGKVEQIEQAKEPVIPEKTLSQMEGPFLEKTSPPTIVYYENELFEIEFSTLGGAIRKLRYKGDPELHAGTSTLFYEGEPTQPGLFGVRILHEKEDLTQKIFKASRRDGNKSFEFLYEKAEEYRLIKKFFIDPRDSVLRLTIQIQNLSDRPRSFPLEVVYGIQPDLTDSLHTSNTETIAWADKIEAASLDKVSKKGFKLSNNILWAGAIKRYFALLLKPDWKIIFMESAANRDTLWTTMRMEPITLEAGETREQQVFIYAGDQRYEVLKSFGAGFENIMSRGFFGMFKIWLLICLQFLNKFTHNYGWAIIILTLLLKGLFAPLTHISFKSMKKMQVIQPKLKSLQERYKKDPEKLNRETMQLFKRNHINPMAGCLPMLIQMPILFAMFRLLPEAIELKGAPFIWWITDLSQTDQLFAFPFTVPVLGWTAFNVLPILMTLSQFWYQKLMPQTSTSPEQAKIMNLMPIFFGFITYNMPSGLVLYWFIQNVLSIIQQVFINRIVIVLHHEDQN